jgi:hypothetical protein
MDFSTKKIYKNEVYFTYLQLWYVYIFWGLAENNLDFLQALRKTFKKKKKTPPPLKNFLFFFFFVSYMHFLGSSWHMANFNTILIQLFFYFIVDGVLWKNDLKK